MKKEENIPTDIEDMDLPDMEDLESKGSPGKPSKGTPPGKGKPKPSAPSKPPSPKQPPPKPQPSAPPAKEAPAKAPPSAKEEALHMSDDIPVQLVAVIGRTTISVKDLMNYQMGQVVDLSRPPSETVDLVASGKLFARGELVDIDGKLGVRIVKIVR